ncbi:hypothetical protein THAOC_00337, partial [Thalassiosira oceanica]
GGGGTCVDSRDREAPASHRRSMYRHLDWVVPLEETRWVRILLRSGPLLRLAVRTAVRQIPFHSADHEKILCFQLRPLSVCPTGSLPLSFLLSRDNNKKGRKNPSVRPSVHIRLLVDVDGSDGGEGVEGRHGKTSFLPTHWPSQRRGWVHVSTPKKQMNFSTRRWDHWVGRWPPSNSNDHRYIVGCRFVGSHVLMTRSRAVFLSHVSLLLQAADVAGNLLSRIEAYCSTTTSRSSIKRTAVVGKIERRLTKTS